MHFGIVILANKRAAPHFDRMVMSLHNQTHTAWRAYVIHIDPEDRIDQFAFPLNRTEDCDILREKFDYITATQENLNEKLKVALDGPPHNHMIGFIPINYRIEHKLLALIKQTTQTNMDAFTVSACGYGSEPPRSYNRVLFTRRDALEKGHVEWNVINGEIFASCPEEEVNKTQVGMKPFAVRFDA